MFLFSLGTIVSPRRKWKQCVCKVLEDKQRVLCIFESGLLSYLSSGWLSIHPMINLDQKFLFQVSFYLVPGENKKK